MYLRKAASPLAMSAMAPDRFSISVRREACRRTWSRSKRATCLSSSTTTINGAAMMRRASHADSRPAARMRTARPISSWRIVASIGPKKFLFRDHGRQRPAGKGKRRQGDRIGLAGLLPAVTWPAAFVSEPAPPACRTALRAIDSKGWSARCMFNSSASGSGAAIGAAVAAKNESRAGLADRELRQELGEAGIFDDDGEHALTFLVDVDRSGKGDRRPRSHRMDRDVEPARLVGGNRRAKPFLFGHRIVGIFEAPLLELDIADHHLVFDRRAA